MKTIYCVEEFINEQDAEMYDRECLFTGVEGLIARWYDRTIVTEFEDEDKFKEYVKNSNLVKRISTRTE